MAAAENFQRVDGRVHDAQARLGELLILKTGLAASGRDPALAEADIPGWKRYFAEAGEEVHGKDLSEADIAGLMEFPGKPVDVAAKPGFFHRAKMLGLRLLDNLGVSHVESGKIIG